MAVTELEIRGYRSLRKIQIPLERLNVVTGPNGSGKSNLYRSLWLIARICEGGFAQSICREGGLLSTMWAGPKTSNKGPVQMSLRFRADDLNFQLTCGFPVPSPTKFCFDPEIKEESVWTGPKAKPSTTLLHRATGNTWIRDSEGRRIDFPLILDSNESVLSQLREPHRFPDLFALREEVKSWRFYHTFRTDDASPMRFPQVSVRTPVLHHDGRDLAAALQTIREVGDGHTMNAIISAALPGRTLEIFPSEPDLYLKSPRSTELNLGLETAGCARTLLARELSDGTLKFLCLVACLMSPRPPSLIALNEPEAGLHPDLLLPLAQLIVSASDFSQVWVSTHSPILANRIQALSGIKPIQIMLSNGETTVESQEVSDDSDA